jgi:hypothetical protein
VCSAIATGLTFDILFSLSAPWHHATKLLILDFYLASSLAFHSAFQAIYRSTNSEGISRFRLSVGLSKNAV